MATCVGCAAPLMADESFCPECGTPAAPRTCPTCGRPVTRGRFCAGCGTALADPAVLPAQGTGPPPPLPVAERRVTSVLFGDLVGFTPISESKDAEEVRDLLSRYFAECRTVIGRYGGTVEKFIGDAVMAVWGVPVAYEDDAERAVRAGLELVAAVTPLGEEVGAPGLAMRVGVVTGEVAVTVGATAEGMVAGDAVNTASRVQSVAEPGQVWVDEPTRSLTSAAIAYTETGEHTLKGKAEPVRLFAARAVVASVRGAQRVDGLEAPLAGRAAELRLVKDLFHATAEAKRARLVLLDGEAGVGKSRLAWEFEKYIDGLSETVAWHIGRCLSYGDGVAFWALAEAIRPRLGLAEGDSTSEVGERLIAGLAELVPDQAERDWLLPRLAVLLGEGGPADFAREDLFSAWSTFLVRVGGGDPVVLVVDDAQHADDGLLDFLDHLLANARGAVFVLALARPELLDRRPQLGARRTSVVRLDPLGEEAMAQLVDNLVDQLPTPVRDALVERAEGIPLFAVETVRALIDRDLVVASGGRYVPVDSSQLDLDTLGPPASLQALVAARLDALSPTERRVVADASVLGTSFTREGLEALAGDVADLDGAVAALQAKEILTLQTDRFSAELGQYRFVQAVVRQVAYATQSRRDRKTRHLAAAEHLSTQVDGGDDLAMVIGQHVIDAVDSSAPADADVAELTDRARDLLERAALRARRLGSPGEAQRLFESALERTADVVGRARLHLASVGPAQDAGHPQVAADHAREAGVIYEQLGQQVDVGIAAAALARLLAIGGDNAGAIEVAAAQWQALDGVAGAEPALLQLAGSLDVAHAARAEYDLAATYNLRRIRLAEALDDQDQLAHAQISLAIQYVATGAPITGNGVNQIAASIARKHGLTRRLAMALNNVATQQISRDLAAALESGREGMAAAHRSGVRAMIDSTTINYLLAAWTAGRLDEVRTLLAELYETDVDANLQGLVEAIRAWVDDAQGVPLTTGTARATTDSEAELAWQGNLALMQARAAGDPVTAAGIAAESIAHVVAASGLEDDFMHLWPPLVEAAIAAGDAELAERLLEPVTSAPAGIVSPAVAAHLLRLRGLVGAVRGTDPALVEESLRAGIAALDDFGAVGACARVQEDLARWLVGQGRAAESGPLLEAARATYDAMGATGWRSSLDTWRASTLDAVR